MNWNRVSVWWIDAVSLPRGWKSYKQIEELADRSPDEAYIMTVGYKMYENKQYIALAQSISCEESTAVLFGDVILIPKGWIKGIHPI